MEPAAPNLFHDLGKLLREGKDVLDDILGCTLEDATVEKVSGWIIQVCGLQSQISSLHLIRGFTWDTLLGHILLHGNWSPIENYYQRVCPRGLRVCPRDVSMNIIYQYLYTNK